jgi:hypothetical protein
MFQRSAALALSLAMLSGAGATGQVGKSAKPAPPGQTKPGTKTSVIPLAPAAQPERVLRYPLLPDPLDLTPGNAAPLWVHAGLIAQEEVRKLKPDEYGWFFNPKPGENDALPKKEARELLDRLASALRLADRAARYTRCDWELPPLTVQNVYEVFPLMQVQFSRLLARLLILRFRIELSEKQFDKAIYSLQTGLSLARHVGGGGTMIENIVGNAFATIFMEGVEEWMRTPGSPSLYWSLTALPSPFLDLRSTAAYELNTIYRSFPSLQRLKLQRNGERLTEAEAERVGNDLFTALSKISPDKRDKLTASVLVPQAYDAAKAYLLSRGWTEEQIKTTPPLTAVLTYYFGKYDEACDDMLKWMSVPPWQSQEGVTKAVWRAKQVASINHNPLIVLYSPVTEKFYEAWLRTERLIAMLRTAEALRMYAATHGGTAPERLSDIAEIPLPIDPSTGKGFEENYAVRDGKAVLEVYPRFQTLRFEMPAGK